MGELVRLASWHLPGGPVGPPSRLAATSNVEVGQTTYPVNRGQGSDGEERRELGTKSQRGGEGMREWNRGGGQGPSDEKSGLYLDICVGAPSS